MCPQVTSLFWSLFETELRPAQRHICRRTAAIERSDYSLAVRHLAHPDLLLALLPNTLALRSALVLVDGDALHVHQDRFRLRRHVANVVARQQRSGQYCPQRHMRAIFVAAHSAVADLEHVRVVPMTGP